MPVIDGQAVNQAVTNAAFIDAVDDDTGIGKITLANTDTISGATVTNLQREHNSAASFMGKAIDSIKNDLPAYTNDEGFTADNSLKERADEISGKFNSVSGHAHSGVAGDGSPIDVLNLDGVQLIGYAVVGIDLTGVTGGSTDVSTELTGGSPSTAPTIKGIVVNSAENFVHIFDAALDHYLDGSGNKVYARLTESATVWTLTYYSNIAGTETSYSFSGSNDVKWYYQELFDESDRPVYSDIFSVKSDQVAPVGDRDKQELPSGAINNSNTAFTVTFAPRTNESLMLFKNGLILIQTVDYTLSGVNITMTVAPDFAEQLYAVYKY